MLERLDPAPDTMERALVERLRAGDERAFDRFVDAYLPGLYRFARRRLGGDPELVRDIVQSTLCKAIEGLAGFRGEAPLAAWLFACCRNEIALHYRRRGRRPEEVALAEEAGDEGGGLALEGVVALGDGAVDQPEARLLREERAELVHATLDQLPPGYARVIEWRYFEGEAVPEIARRLATTYKAAESQLSRARAAFRAVYERLVASPCATAWIKEEQP